MGLAADDPRISRVAYAKLQGDGFEYFVRKYEVLLGRKSKSTELDIVLGDNMNISRQHAKITYNFDLGVFELTVMGKNGVTVNGVLHTPSSAPQQLYTQDFLQVGEQNFYFLLPKGTSRRRPPSASPPAAKPESIAPSMTAEEDEQSQAVMHHAAQVPSVQDAATEPGQTHTNPQVNTAMQNGASILQTQSEAINSGSDHQAVTQTLTSGLSRPVVETFQPSFPAPP